MPAKSLIFSVLACLAFASAAHSAPVAPVAPNSGGASCVLSPAHCQTGGVAGSAGPKANVTEPSGAYCVYSGKSSATGGIELDVFYPAGANTKESKATLDTAIGESSTNTLKPIAV